MQISFALKECRNRFCDGTFFWAVTRATMLINERAYLRYEEGATSEADVTHVAYKDPSAYYMETGPMHLTYEASDADVRSYFVATEEEQAANSWRVIRVKVMPGSK